MRKLVRSNRGNTASNLGKAACGTVLAGSLLVGGPMLSVREAHAQDGISLKERAARGQAWHAAKAAEKQGKWLEAIDKYLEANDHTEVALMIQTYHDEIGKERRIEIYSKLVDYYTEQEDYTTAFFYGRKAAGERGPIEEPEQEERLRELEGKLDRLRKKLLKSKRRLEVLREAVERGEIIGPEEEPEQTSERQVLTPTEIALPLTLARNGPRIAYELLGMSQRDQITVDGSGLEEEFRLFLHTVEATVPALRFGRGYIGVNLGYQHVGSTSQFEQEPDQFYVYERSQHRVIGGLGFMSTSGNSHLYFEGDAIIPVAGGTNATQLVLGTGAEELQVEDNAKPGWVAKANLKGADRLLLYLAISNARSVPLTLASDIRIGLIPTWLGRKDINSLLHLKAYLHAPELQAPSAVPAFKPANHMVSIAMLDIPVWTPLNEIAVYVRVGGEFNLRTQTLVFPAEFGSGGVTSDLEGTGKETGWMRFGLPLGLVGAFDVTGMAGHLAGGYDPLGNRPMIWLTLYPGTPNSRLQNASTVSIQGIGSNSDIYRAAITAGYQ